MVKLPSQWAYEQASAERRKAVATVVADAKQEEARGREADRRAGGTATKAPALSTAEQVSRRKLKFETVVANIKKGDHPEDEGQNHHQLDVDPRRSPRISHFSDLADLKTFPRPIGSANGFVSPGRAKPPNS